MFYRKWSIQQQQNIDNARNRLSRALQNCSDCQALERGLFVYLPMVAFGGGLSTKASASIYAGKASISIATQGLMNIKRDEKNNLITNINIMKLLGDTFLASISGSILGNSSEFNIKINMSERKMNIEKFKLNSLQNVIIGTSSDMLFIRRNKIYDDNSSGKVGQTMIEIQSEIMSQGMSKHLQK